MKTYTHCTQVTFAIQLHFAFSFHRLSEDNELLKNDMENDDTEQQEEASLAL